MAKMLCSQWRSLGLIPEIRELDPTVQDLVQLKRANKTAKQLGKGHSDCECPEFVGMI